MDIWVTLNQAILSPLSIITCFALLWIQLGPSMLAGMGTIFILFPINGFLAKSNQEFRAKEIALADQRIKYITEALTSMKVIKFYGWEEKIHEKIEKTRKEELEMRKTCAFYEAYQSCILIITPILTALSSFLVLQAASPSDFTASNIFSAMSLFNVMRFQVSTLPGVIQGLLDVQVSLKRIRNFLLRDCIEERVNTVMHDISLILPTSSYSWESTFLPVSSLLPVKLEEDKLKSEKVKSTDTSVLELKSDDSAQMVSFTIPVDIKVLKGELVAICGEVGSGKSTLISCILGEYCLVYFSY